jgi:hypothetical protein
MSTSRPPKIHLATGRFGEVLSHPSFNLSGLTYMSLYPVDGGEYIRAIIIGTPETTYEAAGNDIGKVVTIGRGGWIIKND